MKRKPDYNTCDCREFAFIRKGNGHHRIDGEWTPVFPGDLVIVLPGECHGYEALGNLAVTSIRHCPEALDGLDKIVDRFRVFTFKKSDALRRWTSRFPDRKLVIPPSRSRVIQGLLDDLWKEYRRKAGLSFLGILARFLTFLAELDEAFAEPTSIEEDKSLSTVGMITRVIGFLHEHHAIEIRIGELAELFSTDLDHLTRTFRMETGLTPSAYLTMIRINRAAYLLSETDMRVIEIGIVVGYSNHPRFSRKFRQYLICTPRQYRKMTHA